MLSYLPNVTVTRYRLWTPDRQGAEEQTQCQFKDERGDTYELPVHAAMNGHKPAVGEAVGLVVHSYEWNEARVSRADKPYIASLEKRRIVGSFDSAKWVAPAAKVADEFLPAAA